MSLTWIGSPNYTKGRDGNRITKVVIHWMAGTLAATDAVFQDTSRQTSAHYGIEDATTHQYVSEADTAYHAGRWAVNLTSIGIEHSAQSGRDASEATYQTSARLIAEICNRYGLPINADIIVPHRSIVARQCPGTVDLAKLITMAQAIGGDTNVDYKAEYELLKRERDTVTYPRIELLQNERDTVLYPTIENQRSRLPS
jgi:N-acetylmuramoyl-L-alanine amidase CwlA